MGLKIPQACGCVKRGGAGVLMTVLSSRIDTLTHLGAPCRAVRAGLGVPAQKTMRNALAEQPRG